MGREYNDMNISGGHVTGLIPDYIDGTLGSDAQEQVRVHIATCADCRADYIELRATRQMLSAMPVQAPPRAFTLTEEMVGRKRRQSWLERLLVPSFAPTFASGSVVAFLLLIVVVAYNGGASVNTTFSKVGSGLSVGMEQPLEKMRVSTTPEAEENYDYVTANATATAGTSGGAVPNLAPTDRTSDQGARLAETPATGVGGSTGSGAAAAGAAAPTDTVPAPAADGTLAASGASSSNAAGPTSTTSTLIPAAQSQPEQGTGPTQGNGTTGGATGGTTGSTSSAAGATATVVALSLTVIPTTVSMAPIPPALSAERHPAATNAAPAPAAAQPSGIPLTLILESALALLGAALAAAAIFAWLRRA